MRLIASSPIHASSLTFLQHIGTVSVLAVFSTIKLLALTLRKTNAKHVSHSENIKRVRNLDQDGSENGGIRWFGRSKDSLGCRQSDETSVYVMMDVPNPEFMQTFELREDVKAARKLVLMCLLQQ